jgi:uncharacterized repeat protein (TIGR01451 family)
MKKITLLLTLILIAFTLQLTAQSYQHNDITIDQLPISTHDSLSCSTHGTMIYEITVVNSYAGDVISIYDANGQLSFTDINITGDSVWYSQAELSSIHYNINDSYFDNIPNTVSLQGGQTTIYLHNTTDSLTITDNPISITVSNPCQYGDVTGRVYVDMNNDCIYDSLTDYALNGVAIRSYAFLDSPSSVPMYQNAAYTNVDGNYVAMMQQTYMSQYTAQISQIYQFIFPSASCTPHSYTGSSLPQIVDFSLQCPSSVNVQCYANSNGVIRPNIPFVLYPTVSNIGCSPTSGLLKLVLDNRVIYNSFLSTYPADTVIGDTLIWNYDQLTNLTNNGYWNSFISTVHLTPNSTVNIGDTLCFRLKATIVSEDANISNNDYTICLPVVNSYDPNSKEVSPAGDGVLGFIPSTTDSLTYTVRFQNLGTDFAYDVVIIDTLDANIDAGSLVIVGSSHLVTPVWLAPNVVKYMFYGINLPSATDDEAASHGAITFNGKLNSGLTGGTQIRNKAYIYFDYNTPIVTNETINTLDITTGVVEKENEISELKVFPNPVSDILTIESPLNSLIRILNIHGEVIKAFDSNETKIDVSSFPCGVYIIQVKDEKGITSGRFVKI